MTEYRIDKNNLWTILEIWDSYLPGKVHLIACGGTALTIQNIKPSTKDVDFLVPVGKEYETLIHTIRRLGYSQITGSGWASNKDYFIFDLFPGNKVYITELLESPLKKGNNISIKAFKKIYVGALNDHDLIITKMFRGSSVDIEDCMAIIHSRGKKFDVERLKSRYEETAQYDINPERMMQNLDGLLRRLRAKT